MFWCKVKLLIRCFLFIAFFLHIATRPLDRLLHHLQRIWRAQNCHQIESRPKCWPVWRQGFYIFTGCERRSEADSLQRWSHEDEIGRQWERDWQEELQIRVSNVFAVCNKKCQCQLNIQKLFSFAFSICNDERHEQQTVWERRMVSKSSRSADSKQTTRRSSWREATRTLELTIEDIEVEKRVLENYNILQFTTACSLLSRAEL